MNSCFIFPMSFLISLIIPFISVLTTNSILLSKQETQSTFEIIKNQFLAIPKVGGALRLLGFKNRFLKALYEYYVIKSIEKSLL